MIVGLLLVFAVYSATNYYIGRKIFIWLKLFFPNVNGIFYGIIYGCFALTTVVTFVSAFVNTGYTSKVTNVIGRLGEHWMGLYFYSLLLLVISDLILWTGRRVKVIPGPLPRNYALYLGVFLFLAVAGLLSYGRYHAKDLTRAAYDIKVEKSSSLEQLDIVLISDLHLGYINDTEHLAKAVKEINSLKPDIVCMSGDLFNGNYYALLNPSGAMELLQSIESTYGVYACLGNHDAGNSFDMIKSFLEKSNVKVLNDEHVVIDNQVVLVGRKDSSPIGNQGKPRRDTADIFEMIDHKLPVIVMDHQPTNLVEYGNDVDLILSGHTHQGQIFPANLITNATTLVNYGYYRKDESSPQIIVTSGVGTWGPPLRIGTDSEIVQISVGFVK